MDQDRLQRRVEGRNAAKAVIDLLMEESRKLTGDQHQAFWEECRNQLQPLFPERPRVRTNDVPTVVPMTASEVVEFEKETLDFGFHAGKSIKWIARNEPDYLRWLAGLDLTDRLRRYLANEQVANGNV